MLKRVAQAFESIAPLSLSESWDNTGILIDPPKPNNCSKVMLTIDLTQSVMKEAIDNSVGVIVA